MIVTPNKLEEYSTNLFLFIFILILMLSIDLFCRHYMFYTISLLNGKYQFVKGVVKKKRSNSLFVFV